MNLIGVLHHHQFAHLALVHAHLSQRFSTRRQQSFLEFRIRPGLGDDDPAGPFALFVKLLPALLQFFTRRPAALDQRLNEHLEQFLVVS